MDNKGHVITQETTGLPIPTFDQLSQVMYSGSWAVLLTAAIVWVSMKGSVSKVVTKHLEALSTLEKNVEANSQAIRTITSVLARLDGKDTQQTSMLQRIDKKTTYLVKATQTKTPGS